MATPLDLTLTAYLQLFCRTVVLCGCVSLAACATSDVDATTTSAGLRADGNGDQNVSCDEWRTWLGSTFDANDRDRSGQLSGSEYEAFVVDTGLFQAIPLTRIDTSGDRQYSPEEIAEAGTVVFEKSDRNGDCVLSRRELNAPKKSKQTVDGTQPDPGPNVPGEGNCAPPLCRTPAEMFPSKKVH